MRILDLRFRSFFGDLFNPLAPARALDVIHSIVSNVEAYTNNLKCLQLHPQKYGTLPHTRPRINEKLRKVQLPIQRILQISLKSAHTKMCSGTGLERSSFVL
mgnify:CR=1 FL=1